MAKCKICTVKMSFFAQARVLKRYEVAYYRCNGCGFIQTEEPYWLEEAYSEAITESDIGLVSRNNMLALITRSVIQCCFNPEGNFLDYAGGYGLFVRLMRDAGYDFHLYDRYCDNLFAQGFAATASGSFHLVTAFEVVEHMRNPLDEMEQILACSPNVLFTTEVLPVPPPLPGHWWYFGLNHGQHISFFTSASLETMARKLSLNHYTNGKSIHLFTKKKLSPLIFKLATLYPLACLASGVYRRKSLLPSDYEAARNLHDKARP